jgi:hypothetical protein
MKKHIGTLIAGNFYTYNAYKITDYYGRTYYCAEPIGAGVTRLAESVEQLQRILDKDVYSLNRIWTR